MPATASLPVPTTVSIFCSATAGAAATADADADAAAGAGARSQPDTAKVRPITQEESSCFMSFFRGACKKGSHSAALLQFWSGRRVSNSRPQPWQGCALPTELLPRRCHQQQASIIDDPWHLSMALMPILSFPLQRRRPTLVRLAVIADAMREYPPQPGLLLRRPGHAGGVAAVPQRLRDRLQRALEDVALDRLPRHHARAGKQRE